MTEAVHHLPIPQFVVTAASFLEDPPRSAYHVLVMSSVLSDDQHCSQTAARLNAYISQSIDETLQAHPNLGTSGLWKESGEVAANLRRERAKMLRPAFSEEVRKAAFFLAVKASLGFKIDTGAERLAVDATRHMSRIIRVGAVVCAAELLGGLVRVMKCSHGPKKLTHPCKVGVQRPRARRERLPASARPAAPEMGAA